MRSRRTRPPGTYLAEHGVEQRDFNSYGSRRGNHEVMIRGTFANIRLRNQLAPGTEGGFTRDFTAGRRTVTTVYEASETYLEAGHPAGRPRRQGVRLRLVARLGRQGHRAARRQGRHRRVLRADPPLQPDRHGRAAAAVPRGRDRRVARADRRGDVLHQRRHRAQRGPHAEDGQGHRRRRRRSTPSSASTPRARPTTTATAGSCSTSCATCSRPDRPRATRTRRPGGPGGAFCRDGYLTSERMHQPQADRPAAATSQIMPGDARGWPTARRSGRPSKSAPCA